MTDESTVGCGDRATQRGVKSRLIGQVQLMRRRSQRFYAAEMARLWIAQWVETGADSDRLAAIASLNGTDPS